MLSIIRAYSTTVAAQTSRPLLYDILPSKKVISKLLFDSDARYNYNKYLPVVTDIYDKMDTDKEPDTKKMKGSDILLFQRVLKEIRAQTHSANRYLIELEEELIEQAAQMGSRDALTIVSFKALDDTKGEYTQEDKEQATKFVNTLSKLKHPLVFKMGGDYHYRHNELDKAIKLYGKFLKLDNNSFLASEVYRTLGTILFRQQKLMQAKVLMEKSINLAPSSKVAQAHFILGLINEIDPLNSRYHFEMAASEGFAESFANLGFLELNYFKNMYKAKQWFRMGAELNDYNAMVGLFDCYIKEKNWGNADKTMQKIKEFLRDTKQVVDLERIRAGSLKEMRLRLHAANKAAMEAEVAKDKTATEKEKEEKKEQEEEENYIKKAGGQRWDL